MRFDVPTPVLKLLNFPFQFHVLLAEQAVLAVPDSRSHLQADALTSSMDAWHPLTLHRTTVIAVLFKTNRRPLEQLTIIQEDKMGVTH
jgi:hypothetical protein